MVFLNEKSHEQDKVLYQQIKITQHASLNFENAAKTDTIYRLRIQGIQIGSWK